QFIKSGQVRFVNREQAEDLTRELEFQNDSGFVDPATARAVGKVIGAGVYMTVSIDSIRKRGNRVEDVYYISFVELTDIGTWEKVWADEVEIQKTARRGMFGW